MTSLHGVNFQTASLHGVNFQTVLLHPDSAHFFHSFSSSRFFPILQFFREPLAESISPEVSQEELGKAFVSGWLGTHSDPAMQTADLFHLWPPLPASTHDFHFGLSSKSTSLQVTDRQVPG